MGYLSEMAAATATATATTTGYHHNDDFGVIPSSSSPYDGDDNNKRSLWVFQEIDEGYDSEDSCGESRPKRRRKTFLPSPATFFGRSGNNNNNTNYSDDTTTGYNDNDNVVNHSKRSFWDYTDDSDDNSSCCGGGADVESSTRSPKRRKFFFGLPRLTLGTGQQQNDDTDYLNYHTDTTASESSTDDEDNFDGQDMLMMDSDDPTSTDTSSSKCRAIVPSNMKQFFLMLPTTNLPRLCSLSTSTSTTTSHHPSCYSTPNTTTTALSTYQFDMKHLFSISNGLASLVKVWLKLQKPTKMLKSLVGWYDDNIGNGHNKNEGIVDESDDDTAMEQQDDTVYMED